MSRDQNNDTRDDKLDKLFKWWRAKRPIWFFILAVFLGLAIGVAGTLVPLGDFSIYIAIVGFTISVLGFIFELIRQVVKGIAEQASQNVCRQMERQWQDEAAAGFGREWSLLMYLSATSPDDERPLGSLLRQLHSRTPGTYKTRSSMARCLYAFGRPTFGSLEFAMDKDRYMATLRDILIWRLFDLVYWTCPFSPVYHWINSPSGPKDLWLRFASYGQKAIRIFYLSDNLFEILLLRDKVKIQDKEFVDKLKTYPDWLITDITEDSCIIDVRKALTKFLNVNRGTKLFFSRPSMLNNDHHEADELTEFKDLGAREEIANNLKKDYGIYEVEGTKIGILWEAEGNCASILLDIDNNHSKWKPFEYLQRCNQYNPTPRLFADPQYVIQMAHEIGGRTIPQDLGDLTGTEAVWTVPGELLNVVKNHVLKGEM